MQVKEVKKEGLEREYKVTVTAKEYGEEVDARLAEIAKTARMKGFRPGKVPMSVVKNMYGQAVMGEVVEKLVNETSMKALQDNKVRPALQPDIKIDTFEPEKDLEYTIKVQVVPEFDLMDINKIELEKPVAPVNDDTMKDTLERIATQNQGSEAVETKRAAKKGDIAVIDFDGESNGEKLPGMKGEKYHLELGSGSFVPGFEDQVIGQKAGDDCVVEVTFPENYNNEKLAGQPAKFEVHIHELRTPVPAKIDDELATKLGFDNLDKLKEAIKTQIESEFAQYSRMRLKRNLLDLLDENHQFDLPEKMVEMENEQIRTQVQQEENRELTKEELEELKEIAERRVRLGLVLAEYGQRNNVTVSEQDLNQAVMAEARKYPGQETQVFEFYRNNPQAQNALRAPLFEEKVVDYIVELVKVTETEVTAEQLVNDDDHDHHHDHECGDDCDHDHGEKKKPAAKKAPAKKPAAKKTATKKKA